VTDSAQQDSTEQRFLLDRPQRLGILPTRWFWDENWHLVRWGFGALAAVTYLVLSLISPHPIVGGLIAGAVIVLANGLLEKYVRRQAMKRLSGGGSLPLREGETERGEDPGGLLR
jgi:hypothetical protein